jgi:hypothetical protein
MGHLFFARLISLNAQLLFLPPDLVTYMLRAGDVSVHGLARRLLPFEPQLLSHRPPAKVCVLRAALIALNLSEGSPRIGDGATARPSTVH